MRIESRDNKNKLNFRRVIRARGERKRGIELAEGVHREDYCTACKIRTGPRDQIFRRIFRAYQTKKGRREKERESVCVLNVLLYIAELLAAAHFKKPGQ